MPSGVVVGSPGGVPGWCQVLPPSSERWMICPNQPLVCDAYSLFGSAGDPLRWYISQPAKWGPLTSHCSRFPSEVRMNAPLRVPTRTRTLLMPHSFQFLVHLTIVLKGHGCVGHGFSHDLRSNRAALLHRIVIPSEGRLAANTVSG